MAQFIWDAKNKKAINKNNIKNKKDIKNEANKMPNLQKNTSKI